MKLRPNTSGCSVRTKAPTRQSGIPAATRRSQVSASICGGVGADRAPSMSQSISFCRWDGFIRRKFAAQVTETSRARHDAIYRFISKSKDSFVTDHRCDVAPGVRLRKRTYCKRGGPNQQSDRDK